MYRMIARAKAATAAAMILSATWATPALSAYIDLGALGPGKGVATASDENSEQDGGIRWSIDWSEFKNVDPMIRMDLTLVLHGTGYPAAVGLEKYDVLAGPRYRYSFDDLGYTLQQEDGATVQHLSAVFYGFDRTSDEFIVFMKSLGGLDPALREYTVSYSVSPVPIPAAGALFASALGLAGILRRPGCARHRREVS